MFSRLLPWIHLTALFFGRSAEFADAEGSHEEFLPRTWYVDVLVMMEPNKREDEENFNMRAKTYLKEVSLSFLQFTDPKIELFFTEAVRLEGSPIEELYENSLVEGKINAQKLLGDLPTFIHAHNSTPFDVALVLTKKDLRSKDDKNIGLANANSSCTYDAIALVEEGYSTAHTAAHELGHVFGLGHFDQPKSIMHSVSNLSYRRFMSWSIDLIRAIYDKESFQCLRERGSGQTISVQPPAAHSDRTNQCERHLKKYDFDAFPVQTRPVDCGPIECVYNIRRGSFVPRGLQRENGYETPYSDGTQCDQDKACLQGKCVHRSEVEHAYGEPWPLLETVSKFHADVLLLVEHEHDSNDPIPESDKIGLMIYAEQFLAASCTWLREHINPTVYCSLSDIMFIPASVMASELEQTDFWPNSSALTSYLESQELNKFDIGLLMVRKSECGYDNKCAMAYAAGACQGDSRSVAIVKDSGNFQNVGIASELLGSLVGINGNKDADLVYRMPCMEEQGGLRPFNVKPPAAQVTANQQSLRFLEENHSEVLFYPHLGNVRDCSRIVVNSWVQYGEFLDEPVQYTSERPFLDGTRCGDTNACLNGECVPVHKVREAYGHDWEDPTNVDQTTQSRIAMVMEGLSNAESMMAMSYFKNLKLRVETHWGSLVDLSLTGLHFAPASIIKLDPIYMSYESNTQIIAQEASKSVHEWLKNRGVLFDVAVFLTRRTVVEEQKGWAYVGGACKKDWRSVVTVENRVWFQNIDTAVEMLGQVMAIRKDGNSDTFSMPYLSCLQQTKRKSENVKASPPGAIMSKVEQCQAYVPQNHKHMIFPHQAVDTVCNSLICITDINEELQYGEKITLTIHRDLLDGTSCRKKMACLDGRCVKKSIVRKAYGKRWNSEQEKHKTWCLKILILVSQNEFKTVNDTLSNMSFFFKAISYKGNPQIFEVNPENLDAKLTVLNEHVNSINYPEHDLVLYVTDTELQEYSVTERQWITPFSVVNVAGACSSDRKAGIVTTNNNPNIGGSVRQAVLDLIGLGRRAEGFRYPVPCNCLDTKRRNLNLKSTRSKRGKRPKKIARRKRKQRSTRRSEQEKKPAQLRRQRNRRRDQRNQSG